MIKGWLFFLDRIVRESYIERFERSEGVGYVMFVGRVLEVERIVNGEILR